MLKLSVTSLALLGSVSSLRSGETTARSNKHQITHLGLKDIIAKQGKEVIHDSNKHNVKVSNHEDNQWLMLEKRPAYKCDDRFPVRQEGYRMGACTEDTGTTGVSSNYIKYSCQPVMNSANILVTEEIYTDSMCNGTFIMNPVVMVSSQCDDDSGYSFQCAMDNNYTAVQKLYGNGGLAMSAYMTTAECNEGNEDDLMAYAGVKGCDDGDFYGRHGASFYDDSDNCMGSPDFEWSYYDTSVLDLFCSGENDDGDDYDDDYDDDDVVQNGFDNMKYSGRFNTLSLPEVDEFGKFTTGAYRAGKSRWVGDQTIEHGDCDIFRFNTVGIRSIIQSPSEEAFNAVVEISHPKRKMHVDRSFVNITIHDNANNNDYQFSEYLFEDSLLITHLEMPEVTTGPSMPGTVVASDDNFRFVVSIDFESNGIPKSLNNTVDIEVSSFRVNSRNDWILDAVDCAKLHDVGVLPYSPDF
jgi:hypothetical protein